MDQIVLFDAQSLMVYFRKDTKFYKMSLMVLHPIIFVMVVRDNSDYGLYIVASYRGTNDPYFALNVSVEITS